MISSALSFAPLLFALASPEPVVVAAASDLSGAFTEIGKAFEAEPAHKSFGKVSFTFAASGVLTKQLQQGAPFDVFAGANASFVDDAVAAGACDGTTKALYARGHLVVWTRKGGRVSAPRDLAELADARVAHIAIANPATAPYGAASKEALTAVGIWPKVAARIVVAENVRQALQLAESGNADVAIVARSLVTNAQQPPSGTWIDVDDKLHAPLDQALAVCALGRNRAGGEAFARFVTSAKGQEILRRFGFTESAAATSTAKKP